MDEGTSVLYEYIYIYIRFCATVRRSDLCMNAFVYLGSWGLVVVWGGGGQTEDWGVIQSLYKWVWLIEGASDPDWYTAGAQLIEEGGEWRREWRKKGKREYGPQRKCSSAVPPFTPQGSCQMLIPGKRSQA